MACSSAAGFRQRRRGQRDQFAVGLCTHAALCGVWSVCLHKLRRTCASTCELRFVTRFSCLSARTIAGIKRGAGGVSPTGFRRRNDHRAFLCCAPHVSFVPVWPRPSVLLACRLILANPCATLADVAPMTANIGRTWPSSFRPLAKFGPSSTRDFVPTLVSTRPESAKLRPRSSRMGQQTCLSCA